MNAPGLIEWRKAPRRGAIPVHYTGWLGNRELFVIWPVRVGRRTTYALRRAANSYLLGDYGSLSEAKIVAQFHGSA